MTFGELFAGIGGFSLGLERAGMTCKWQVEIDPYASAVLKKHWPEVPKWNDVRTFPPQGDWGVDLICGGFPCQDISVAGKGAGLAGARSGLWHEFARIIRTVRPRWVVIENVPALTARGLGTVLGDLAEIGMDAEWHCIPASAVGAPHRRDRIWIVANAVGAGAGDFAGSTDRRGRRNLGRRLPPLRQAHGAAGSDRTDPAGAVAPLAANANGKQRPSGHVASADVECDVCGPAQLCDGQGEAVAALATVADAISQRDAVRRDGATCSQGVAGRGSDAGGSQCDSGPGRAGRAGEGAGDVANASCGGQPIVRRSSRGARHTDKCCADVANSKGFNGWTGLCQGEPQQDGNQFGYGCCDVPDADRAGRQQQRRPKSIRAEQPAAQCGGWWESEPDVGRVAHGVPSRVDRLRCLGNAVVPQVVEIIGRAILAHEERSVTA